jgi:hypothetical protein
MTSLDRLTPEEAAKEREVISGRGKWSRRNKYNAVKTIIGEHRFDSRKEVECWQYLRARERAGEIEKLERQVKYELWGAHPTMGQVQKVCTYVADFRYFDKTKNETVVADAKGVKTALFNLKSKLMLACHGIEVELM